MKRRTFLIGAGAAAWSRAARGQQRIARIGYMVGQYRDLDAPLYAAFRAGLRDVGLIEGETVEVLPRFVEAKPEILEETARELIDLKVDIIATAALGVYAAYNATKTVPIVICAGGDLVGLHMVESLAHPGGNMTGSTILGPQLLVKRAEMLKLVRPSATRLGLVAPKGATVISNYLRVLEAPAKTLGVTIAPVEIAGLADFDRALAEAGGAPFDGLILSDLVPDETGAAALRHGLPSAGSVVSARGGALGGYGVDFAALYRRAGVFIDKILKGANPGDIPIEQTSRFKVAVNLKTAAALGLDVPASLLAAADEVIE